MQTILLYEKNDFVCTFSDNMGKKPHLHHEIEVIYLIEGEVEVEYNSETHTMVSGDFLLIFPHMIHGFHPKTPVRYLLSIVDKGLLPSFSCHFSSTVPDKIPLIPSKILDPEVKFALQQLKLTLL